MKWLVAIVAVLGAALGMVFAAGAVAAGVGFLGLALTSPLHHEGGMRGIVQGSPVPMPVGPDGVFGTVRVYACNPLSDDGQCSPTRQFDVFVGSPAVSLLTDDGAVDLDLGEPYEIWRGDYTRRAQTFDRWSDVPASIRSQGQVEPADGYQLKVLSVADGENVHVYGQGDDRRIVIGAASSAEATAGRLRLLTSSRWGLGLLTATLALLCVATWGIAVVLGQRARALWRAEDRT